MTCKSSNAQSGDFEDYINRLQEIVSLLQEGDMPLKKSLEIYKEGLACVKHCRTFLEQAKKEIEIWQREEINNEDIDKD